MKSNSFMVEMAVVFKKDVSEETAKKLLDEQGISYRTGIDSSRGKQYFYSTGPKFLVDVQEDAISGFFDILNSQSEIYEVYKADWNIVKD